MNLAIWLPKYGVKLDDPCCYPLGLMYISAKAKALGHSVTWFNHNLESYPISVLEDFDAVLLTGFESFLPEIKRVGAWGKKNHLKTILGGALATYYPTEMAKWVDVVVAGEGDEVLEQALQMRQGIVAGTKPNLEEVLWPDYYGVGIAEYHRRNKTRHMGVLTARGCPFSCTFCGATCSYQARTLSSVCQEVGWYIDHHGADRIVFNDNTLNVSRPRWFAICEMMSGFGVPWSAAIRTDKIDEAMVQAAKDSGGEYFVVGVESFNQKKLAQMNKRTTVEMNTRTLDLLHKYDIDYHGNILFGFPGETIQDIQQELFSLPSHYNLYPVVVQPFAGCGVPEREDLAGVQQMFMQFAESRGMNVYRGAA